MKGKYKPAIKRGKVVYANREARDSQEVAHALETVEAYLIKQGDRVAFAWASTHAVIADSEQGVRLMMGTAEAACKIEAAVIATREQIENAINNRP